MKPMGSSNLLVLCLYKFTVIFLFMAELGHLYQSMIASWLMCD
jgi:hypothetical protein